MAASVGPADSLDKRRGNAVPAVSAVVLAGGRSSRMGADKASLILEGRSLLQRVIDVVEIIASEIVVVGSPERPVPALTSTRPVVVIADPVEGQGPLAGLLAGLQAVSSPVTLVVGCDQPFLRSELLRWLVSEARLHPAVIPVLDGRPQPLCCAVQAGVLDELRAAWEQGRRAAMVLADVVGARLVPEEEWRPLDPEARSFTGVNTPDELGRAGALLRALPSEGQQASTGGD